MLLQYKDNWVAYNNRQGIIAFGRQLDEVIKQAEAVTDDFNTWHVSKHFGQPRAFVVRMAKKNVYTLRDDA